MKAFFAPIIAIALTAGWTGQAVAADRMEHSSHGATHAAAEAPLADGQVRKVDKTGGKLTVSHGPLPNGMPAMTMAFKVRDAGWLEKVKEGQKIRFAVEDVGGALTITRLEPAR